MAVNLSPIWGAGAQLLDNSGNVLSGGKIYTYAAGTTTQVTTYTSATGGTANSNPIVLNSAGRVPYEIWLTDGQNYKFVLKDSNDVLIGTWDNLSGINSNFIAYTNQQEIQTATAGQTVFNLTTMNYLPATNSLSVFVDGVNQYGPGASYAYEETDSNTVTFNSGLHDGAEVKFTSSQIQNAGVADASQITYDPPFTGAVATNVELKLAQTVSVKDFGAVGDGVTDDAAAIQSALNALESAGGGTLTVPWPSVSYNLGTTGIDIPSYVSVVCLGNAGITSGNTQFTYSGTGAAIRMKDGEGVLSGTFRSISITGLGVELTTASATGFRIRHGRDGMFERCSVRMTADNQIGFHLQAEAGSSSNLGVFDCTFIRCNSYTSSAAFTGALHYKLSGVSGSGQCNANVFLNCRGGGSGQAIQVGPSNMNAFYGCEFEAITGDCIQLLADAYENGFTDLYVEAQTAWTGKIFNSDVNALRNYLEGFTAGANTTLSAFTISNGNYVRWNGKSRIYAGASTDNILSSRVVGDSQNRWQFQPRGVLFGDATATPDKLVSARQMTVVATDFSSGAANSVTPDVSIGLIQSIRLLAGSSGTLTINAPTNAVSEGDTLQFQIYNNSGGAITLSWNAAFVRNANFPTSLTDGHRVTLMATNINSVWYLMGTPIDMG